MRVHLGYCGVGVVVLWSVELCFGVYINSCLNSGDHQNIFVAYHMYFVLFYIAPTAELSRHDCDFSATTGIPQHNNEAATLICE